MRCALIVVVAMTACGRIGFDERRDAGSISPDAVACLDVPTSDPANCVLATGQDKPFGLALTATDVIWLDAGDGALRKCAKTGCAGVPTLLAQGNPLGYFVTVDATHVYWNHNATGEVLRCPLDGCPGAVPQLIAPVNTATFVVVDNTYLYTSTNDGRLVRVLKSGGTPTDLATGATDPTGIALSGSAIFWAIRGENRITTVPLTGGTATTVVPNQMQPYTVAATASVIAWPTTTSIVVSDLAGQGVTTIAAADAPKDIEIDGSYVYWPNSSATTIAKAPIAGGPTTILATGITFPSQIAVDGQYVFVTSYDDGNVYRVAK